MTSHEEDLLTEALDRQAAGAPTDESLLTDVHSRLRDRRRRSRTVGMVALACAAVAVTVTVGSWPSHDSAPAGADIPGWRWESYETVQVQVPDSWTNFASGPAPCTNLGGSTAPAVGRLDRWTDRDKSPCTAAVLPAAERREYLWFADVQEPGIKHYDQGWTEETRLVNGVKLSVLSKDDALRRRILDTAIPITGTDHYGCKSSESLGTATPVGSKDKVGAVEWVDICEYWTGPLMASSRLTGPNARALAKGLADAPEGNPPSVTPGCLTAGSVGGYGYGNSRTRIYLLRIHGSTGDWQTRLTYTSCFTRNQFPSDDGVGKRLAPITVVDLIRTGVHRPATTDLVDPPGNLSHSPR